NVLPEGYRINECPNPYLQALVLIVEAFIKNPTSTSYENYKRIHQAGNTLRLPCIFVSAVHLISSLRAGQTSKNGSGRNTGKRARRRFGSSLGNGLPPRWPFTGHRTLR